MKKLLWIPLAVIGAVVAFLLLAPTRVEPVAWTAPAPPSLNDGPYAHNDRLESVERIAAVGAYGPESLATDAAGLLYSGYQDGSIFSFDADGAHARRVANTGGRPLGIAQMPDSGNLIVADARKGLLQIDKQGRVTTLAATADGQPLGFPDDVAVDAQGHYAYFSDASSKWGYGREQFDLLEHGGFGRLLRYEIATGATTTLLRGLQFANGVTLGPDEAYVLVVETGAYRVTRYWLKGDRAGRSDVFVDNLPFLPDNIRFNGRDRFWVAGVAMRSPLLDRFDRAVFVRKMLARLGSVVNVPVESSAMAVAYDPSGKLIANLQYAGPDAYRFITQATEIGPWLYLSSWRQASLARIPLAKALGSS
jgi:sugar lactone lactonase YvrE